MPPLRKRNVPIFHQNDPIFQQNVSTLQTKCSKNSSSFLLLYICESMCVCVYVCMLLMESANFDRTEKIITVLGLA